MSIFTKRGRWYCWGQRTLVNAESILHLAGTHSVQIPDILSWNDQYKHESFFFKTKTKFWERLCFYLTSGVWLFYNGHDDKQSITFNQSSYPLRILQIYLKFHIQHKEKLWNVTSLILPFAVYNTLLMFSIYRYVNRGPTIDMLTVLGTYI